MGETSDRDREQARALLEHVPPLGSIAARADLMASIAAGLAESRGEAERKLVAVTAERDALIAAWPVDVSEDPLDEATTIGVIYETPDGWQAVGVEGTYATAAGAIRAAAGLASEGYNT